MSKHLKSISVSNPDAASLPSLETWYRFSTPVLSLSPHQMLRFFADADAQVAALGRTNVKELAERWHVARGTAHGYLKRRELIERAIIANSVHETCEVAMSKPSCAQTPTKEGCEHGSLSISLRDYFAGQALTGLLAGWTDQSRSSGTPIVKAYKMADAMLVERHQNGDLGGILAVEVDDDEDEK